MGVTWLFPQMSIPSLFHVPFLDPRSSTMHIVNGDLIHGDFLSPLSTWQPTSSRLFNAVFAATIATILSYQLTAFFFDLCFGRRFSGKTSISDIHTKLLIDETSPISLLAAVFRRDILDSLRLHLKVHKHAYFARSNSSIKKRVLAKLAMLLVAAPLFNVICVVFTTEITEVISFADANFGGIAQGFNEDLSTILSKPNQKGLLKCGRFHTVAQHDMRPVASFHRCDVTTITRKSVSQEEPHRSVVLSSGSNGTIVVSLSGTIPPQVPETTIELFRFTFHTRFFAFISVPGKDMRLASKLDVEMMRKVMAMMKSRIRILCDTNPLVVLWNPKRVFPAKAVVSEDRLSISQTFTCKVPDNQLGGIAAELTALIRSIVTLVDAPFISIVEDGSGLDSKNGDDLPFLTRKKTFLGPASLCITLAIVLALRLLISQVYCNDVDSEIEAMLNRFFGISCGDSLLHYNFRFCYNNKKFVGNEVQYGIAPGGGEHMRI